MIYNCLTILHNVDYSLFIRGMDGRTPVHPSDKQACPRKCDIVIYLTNTNLLK
jgi:hypothetical protein